MISYDAAQGRYKDQSIGDTPKVYSILVNDEPTKVVGVGCKNGGFYVLRADDGQIVDHTPIYTGPPTYPLSPEPDPRMKWTDKVALARPEAEEYLQAGCKFAGRCPFVMDVCRRVVPKDVVAEGRTVKCHLYDPAIPESDKRPEGASRPLQPVV